VSSRAATAASPGAGASLDASGAAPESAQQRLMREIAGILTRQAASHPRSDHARGQSADPVRGTPRLADELATVMDSLRIGDQYPEPPRARLPEPAISGGVPQQAVPVDAAVVRQLASRGGRTSSGDCWAAVRLAYPQGAAALQEPLDDLLSPSGGSARTVGDLIRVADAEAQEGAAELEAALQSVRVLGVSLQEAIERARSVVARQAWLHVVRTAASVRDVRYLE
jgi:hypothetical protein